MTEEEKKAIEYLTKWAAWETAGERNLEGDIETALNLIKKQQKEKELLANGIRILGTNPDITTEEIIKEFTEKPISEEYMKKFKSSYISKDKIREAIKDRELEIYADNEEICNADGFCNIAFLYDKTIDILKGLLEEE